MDPLKGILAIYEQDERIRNIREILTNGKQSIACNGMSGAFACFLINQLRFNHDAPTVVVASDRESAAYMYNTLEAIGDKKDVFFLPGSFKKAQAFEEFSKGNILERTTVISKISDHPAQKIVVTYPETVLEKAVLPSVLNENRLIIESGEQLDADTAIEVLVEYGFEHTEFVYEPGQFSVRGGIIDIFSFGNEWPYRIELFDTEIESIRTFDPLNQLSKQNIARVSIIPNMQSEFTNDQKKPLLSILPKNSRIIIFDYANLLERIIRLFDEYATYTSSPDYLTCDDILRRQHELFSLVIPDEWTKKLGEFNTLFFNSGDCPFPITATFNFNIKPQPSFNKNFNLLIDNLTSFEKDGYANYLFTQNTKQINRFYSIFEDLKVQVSFQPISIDLHEGFIDVDNKIVCYTDHQIFDRFHRYKLKRGFTKEQSLNVKMLRELKPGDFVSHIDHGLGRYSGLEKININGHLQESVRLIYKNNDLLYVSINSLHKISRYSGKEGHVPQLNKLGSENWKTLKIRTKKKVKDIAKELIKLYAKRKASKGYEFPPDGYMQTELEASFIYEDTPDQITATQEVKEDMMRPFPMDRLICGDVGFGKTEIAIRAAFKAIMGGKQVAILVPTTILALQHYHTFKDRLKDMGVEIDYINRFRSTAEKKIIMGRLESGELDLIIGTHAILNKNISFKDLGLLVIDEEQKFGVTAKERLRNIKINVDTLTLTATPIPRTLQFSLMAARDMSILRTAPPNRQPIYTERCTLDDKLIKEAINYEINRGGQVFFVHNRVASLPEITTMLMRLCPDAEIATAHGQMESKLLEKRLIGFINNEFEVLVCTNIIETGLDIPNANTIIINNAHQFGLSDLHQLRGRVGRSNKKAFCYLFSPPVSVLTPEARKRIKTIEEFSDLGSGFEIAMRDMDIRGAGNLLGGEQSGFISEIGYETYQRILEEAIVELKENEYKELFYGTSSPKDKEYVRDVEIDADVEMLIPDEYISVIQERLNLYTQLDKIKDEDELHAFEEGLRDRFGPIPNQVLELFDGLRLRWACKKLGFVRVVLKNDTMRAFFVDNPQSSYFESNRFKDILSYVNDYGEKKSLRFKQTRQHFIMICDRVETLKEAKDTMDKLIKYSTSSEMVVEN